MPEPFDPCRVHPTVGRIPSPFLLKPPFFCAVVNASGRHEAREVSQASVWVLLVFEYEAGHRGFLCDAVFFLDLVGYWRNDGVSSWVSHQT